MANFNSMLLTEKGQILYAKAQAGATINFTKMAVGIGNIGSTDPTTLIELISKKFDIAIQSKTVNTAEKVALISGTLTNTDMTESVYLQEIGLYAQDPDGGEILYSYASAGQYGDYTSPASNGPYAWNYQVYAAIGNAANVTVILSNLQYDTSVVNSNTTLSIIKGSNQKDINKSIDNKLKPYTTTNSGNVYALTSSDIDTLTDGYPLLVRFNAASTSNISFVVNGSNAHDVVDYFGNKISNVRNGLIAKLIWDESNSNFQLQGKGGGGNVIASQLLLGVKATADSGPVIGTMPNNGPLGIQLPINGTYNIPAGYTTGGTVNQSVATKAYAEIMPSQSDQVIGANQWLTGNQVIKGDGDLIAPNIVSTANIFGVQGTATIQSLGGIRCIKASITTDGLATSFVISGFNFTPVTVLCSGGYNDNTYFSYENYYYMDGISSGFRLHGNVGGASNLDKEGGVIVSSGSVTITHPIAYSSLDSITYKYEIYG